MNTVQEVMDLARLDLNDLSTSTANYRYPDADLLKYANDGIARAYVMRPDLKFGAYDTQFTDLAADQIFPLGIEYRSVIAAYIVARNQSGDDEFVIQQRAQLELGIYLRSLGVGG